MKVLFVCTANICRSAYAEVVARQLAGPDSALVFDSAGILAADGLPMDPPMAAEAERRGADSHAHRSKRLTLTHVDDSDVILTAETGHRVRILEDRPLAMRKAFTLGQFARGLQASRDDPGGVLERVRTRAATSRPDDDVDDPYGRGHGQAQLAAIEIEALLRLILPALEAG